MDNLEAFYAIEQNTSRVIDLGLAQGMSESSIRSEVARAIEVAFTRTVRDRSGPPTLAAIAANLYIQAFNQFGFNRGDMHLQETCLAAAQRVLDQKFTGTSVDYSRLGKTWKDQLQEVIDSIRSRGYMTDAIRIPVEGEIESLDLTVHARIQGYRGCVNASEFCGVPARRLRLASLVYVESPAGRGRLRLIFALLLSSARRQAEADFDDLPSQ